jgi:hypothetical protein
MVERRSIFMTKPTAGLAVSLIIGLVGLAAQTPGQNPADELYTAIRGGDIAKVSALVQAAPTRT